MSQIPKETTLLLVANYDSGVGYAWWLIESFWTQLAEQYHYNNRVVLAYPTISQLPVAIRNASLHVTEFDFTRIDFLHVLAQCKFLIRNRVRAIYFSDMHLLHWRYCLYRLAGVKLIIIHEHTPGERTPVIGLKSVLKGLLHRLPWIVADGAVGATDFVRQRFVDVCCMPKSRSYSAPNGLPPINQAVRTVDLHQMFNISCERKILVMTGRAHRYKGVDFVIQCMNVLLVGNCKVHFLFIGDGPDLANFESTAAELGVADHCTFVGHRNDACQILEGADIAIHPSRGEVGYSLSILEYMRAGLPLVVPDNPSVCSATSHEVNGFIYPEGDVSSAVRALGILVNDDTLREIMGENARISAKQYTLENTHRALLAAFAAIDRKGILSESAGAI